MLTRPVGDTQSEASLDSDTGHLAKIRCESSQAKCLFFASIHNQLYEKSMVIFVLFTSLDAKLTLAARARARRSTHERETSRGRGASSSALRG